MSLSHFKFREPVLHDDAEVMRAECEIWRPGVDGASLANEDGSETFVPWWNIIYIHTEV